MPAATTNSHETRQIPARQAMKQNSTTDSISLRKVNWLGKLNILRSRWHVWRQWSSSILVTAIPVPNLTPIRS